MEPTTLIILAIVAILIVGIGWLVPYLKGKGILTSNTIETTKQLLQIADLIVKNINLKDKSQTDVIFDVTNKAVSYVEQTMKDSDNQDKKFQAYSTTISILDSLKIALTDDNKKLIEVGIEAAVNALPKTNVVIKPAISIENKMLYSQAVEDKLNSK